MREIGDKEKIMEAEMQCGTSCSQVETAIALCVFLFSFT